MDELLFISRQLGSSIVKGIRARAKRPLATSDTDHGPHGTWAILQLPWIEAIWAIYGHTAIPYGYGCGPGLGTDP